MGTRVIDPTLRKRGEGMGHPASGLKATFISREDLISAKLASGRTQDSRKLRKSAKQRRDVWRSELNERTDAPSDSLISCFGIAGVAGLDRWKSVFVKRY